MTPPAIFCKLLEYCFNPHTHEGCDTDCSWDDWRYRCFNPHTHEGCDTHLSCSIDWGKCFNPHTHEGCDCPIGEVYTHLIKFQSTHPRRVWQEHCINTRQCLQFQSTHPRRVWRYSSCYTHHGRWVSIHTPTKGVTSQISWHKITSHVSIHTPTKGVTCAMASCCFGFLFQSTHPRRVWLINFVSQSVSSHVSIHTPTKGVTQRSFVLSSGIFCFNPHTHEGCDKEFVYGFLAILRFNPHTHEGCDNISVAYLPIPQCFNPHTHEGCDAHPVFWWIYCCSFNPHTHEGCDLHRTWKS